jgi:hypothetical protein
MASEVAFVEGDQRTASEPQPAHASPGERVSTAVPRDLEALSGETHARR